MTNFQLTTASGRQYRQQCIFCSHMGNLTKTHIWPKWLKKLVPSNHEHRLSAIVRRPAGAAPFLEPKLSQGSLFSQAPKLTCQQCNGGWMKTVEDDVRAFAAPIITGSDEGALSHKQVERLAALACLITILAEYTDPKSMVVSFMDREILKNTRLPPPTWCIYVASLSGEVWRNRYAHHQLSAAQGGQVGVEPLTNRNIPLFNTQITSLGIGRVFFQALSCPDEKLRGHFQSFAAFTGMARIWPIKVRRNSPFTPNATYFPPSLVLNDEQAYVMANEFHDQLSAEFMRR